jgi:hypothetical protein
MERLHYILARKRLCYILYRVPWCAEFLPRDVSSARPVPVGRRLKSSQVTVESSDSAPTCEAVKGDAQMAANGMYVVIQVVLKEKLLGTGSGNLTELENAINAQAALGYRLHTITTAASGSKGFGGGDRIQATLVFERIV